MEEITRDNIEYLKVMAALFEKEPGELLNNIVEADRKRNEQLYKKAAQEMKAGNGEKISFYKLL